MKNIFNYFFTFILITGMFLQNISAQTKTIGGTGSDYATLKLAFDAINAGTISGSITLQITGSTTETATASLNASGSGSASYSSVLIYPTGSGYTISGNINNALITLKGAKNITVDGRVNAAGSVDDLTISNTNAGTVASTMLFIDSAAYNTVKYCFIKGSSINTSGGVIFFSTATAVAGNSYNTIDNCNLTNAGSRPFNIIYSSCSGSYLNSSNTVSNNNVYNFINAGTSSYGINIGANSTSWSITGNSFYDNGSITPTAGVSYYSIFITNTSGNNFSVTGNYIGGNASAFTGPGISGRWTMTAATQIFTYTGIYLNVGTTTPSNVQNNIIGGISLSMKGTGSAYIFTGINIIAGSVNVGTTSANTIGATSGTISITSATSLPYIGGIYAKSSGTVNIQNNNIGSINTGGGAAIGYTFYGINTTGAAGNFTISGNNIGNGTTNSIAMGANGTTTAITTIFGINNSATGTISITGNTIQNCSSFGSGASVFTGIINSGVTASLNMNSNTLASNTLAGTGVYTGISNTAAVTTTININNNTISSGTLSAATASGAVTILNNSSAGITSTLSISTNSISGISYTGATGGAATFTGINNSGTPLGCTINYNNFNNLSFKTTAAIYLINNAYTAPANGTKTVQNNYITTACARTAAGTGAFYCYNDQGGSPGTVSHDISGNKFSNITINSSNTGGFNGIYSKDFSASNPSLTAYNNTINNVSCGTGNVFGIYLNGFGGTSSSPNLVYNDTVNNISSASISVNGLYIGSQTLYVNAFNNAINTISTTGAASFYGIYLAGGTGINAYNNNTNTLSSTGTTTIIYGIYVAGGTTNSVYKNKIYNLTSSGATASAFGYYVNGGTTNNFYNNFISDIKTPSSTTANAVAGIYLNAGTTNNLFYNTIYLNTSSTGTTFGSSGIYSSTIPATSLRNNIIINLSAPGSTSGFTSALRFSSTTLTNYASSSNNNNFYAGNPGTRNLIFYNGTTSYQTIATFKVLVTPRDASSHTDNTPFINTSLPPNDLHILSSTPTFCESNGIRISSPIAITDDIDGQPRYGETGYSGTGTAPDIGADEGDFTYLPPSVVSVSISADQCMLSNQVYSGTTVTLSAIPANGGTNPSFQWKLNGNIVGTNNTTYSFIPANNDLVICVMTSNMSYVSGNPATSNSINLIVYPHQTKHYVATTGTDYCSGIINNPWLTIQYAVNNSITGDTIIVDAGTYNIGTNQILINKSIVLQAKAGLSSKPKITTSYTSYSYCAVRIAADNVVVDGFEIDGSSAFSIFPSNTSCYLIGDYNTTNTGYNNWTVKNCYLHHGRNGVRLSANNYITIQGNEIGQIIGNCIDCGHGTCNGIKITHNWLHSEQTQYGAKPAGIYYIFDHAAGADIEISYNYCTACRTFCDFAQNNNGPAPSNQVLIKHNTVDWKPAPLTSPVQASDNAQLWAIAWWASDTAQKWNASEFIIRDNIFSRLKYYAIAVSGGALTGQLELKNNLFYQWYLVDAYYPGNAYALEWPAARGAVGWNITDNIPAFTNNDTLNPLYVATGTTASEYYALTAGSPALETATDGKDIGAWQRPLYINATNVTCPEGNDGSATAIPNGIAPYTYIWNTSQSTAAINNLLIGSYSVTVTDAIGSIAIATGEVGQYDGIPPDITCPSNISVNNTLDFCDAIVTYTAPVGTDNCSGASIVQTEGFVSGATFPVGTTMNTFKVTDAAGNTSTSSFTITVTDNEKPVISGCPSNITQSNDAGHCNAIVTWTEPTASDNCTPSGNLVWSISHTPGSIFPAGTTIVTYTSTDAASNTSLTCSFDVTVTDDEIPTITCVGNQQKQIDYGAPDYTVQGTEFNPLTYHDNCSVSISNNYSHTNTLAGAKFVEGTTTVIWTVSDIAMNISTCSFDVSIIAVELKVKVILQAAFNTTTGLMNKKLDSLNLIPASQPYNIAPWNYSGAERLRGTNTDIVDWVFVELRGPDTTTVVDRRAGLLMKNGDIKDTNLTTGLIFTHIALNSSYYVTILHRNHLPVMSGSLVTIPNPTAYDFSDTLHNRPYGGGEKALIELEGVGAGKFAMIGGDVNSDGRISYSGAGNDRGLILQSFIIHTGRQDVTGLYSNVYLNEDVTMNGVLQYSNAGRDPQRILQNLMKLKNNVFITGSYISRVPGTNNGNYKGRIDGPIDLIAKEDSYNYYISLQTKQTIENGLIDNIQFTISWNADDLNTERLISGYSSPFNIRPEGNIYTHDGKKYLVFATVEPKELPGIFETGQSDVIMTIPKNGNNTVLLENIDLSDDESVQNMEGTYYVSVWGEDMTGNVTGNTSFIYEYLKDNLILSYYPNPALNGKFTINVSTTSDQVLTLKVFDAVGVCVYDCQLDVNSNTPFLKEVNLDKLSKGTYLIDISNSRLKYSGKLIIF